MSLVTHESSFRPWLSLEELSAAGMRETDTAEAHTTKLMRKVPFLADKRSRFDELVRQPFQGVTTNGLFRSLDRPSERSAGSDKINWQERSFRISMVLRTMALM